MKAEYQETPIGKIPKDWEVIRLEDIFSLEYGKGLPERKRIEGKYPVFGSNGIIGYHRESLVNGPGIIVGRKGTIGAVSWIDSDFWPIDTAYYVNIKRKDIFLKWLFFELNHLNLKKLHLADVVPGLKRELVHNIKISLPPLPEQKSIASILSTVDDAIEKADEGIAKTEKLKKGLMQELLTKGIGHKEFEFSKELGIDIPKEWDVIVLKNACFNITDGSHFSPKEDENGEYRIATVANINQNRIDVGTCKKISKSDYENLVKNGCKPNLGDVLFSKDGTVGLCFSFKQDEDIVLLSSIAIIKAKNMLDPDFCAYILKSPVVFQRIIGSKRGTGLRRIILEDLKRIKIPLPKSIKEQQKIVKILSSVDKKLELQRHRKAKLERIKKGLMNDLLTGKRRVNIAR